MWYEHAYAGGGPVKVKGFPRPIYPPDANKHGKKPSADGPDIKAYKRIVSRLGRWPWQEFDDSFSNAFSHGNGPNVRDAGVAGVQRQQDIDDSGWIGKKTFDTFRYAKVPVELPHGGEQAMDAEAVRLIDKAWEMFQGHEPSEPGGTCRRGALDLAISQLGIKEAPPDSNKVKYTSWYGMVGPWCAMFVSWCYEQNPLGPSPSFVQGSRYSYVPYIVADARNGKNGLKTTDDPQPGDLVCYDWEWNGEYDHIGLFEKWAGGESFQAIEGNTSTSSNSNGGQVMRRTRSRGGQGTVFVRVSEP